MAEHSPTPWRVDDIFILDADGGAIAAMCEPEYTVDAAFIVEAVNGVDATLKLQRALLGWTLERDRLRDLVRRLAQRLQMARLEGFGGLEREKLLDEAREAIGEGEA